MLTSMLGVWYKYVEVEAKKSSVKLARLNQTEAELRFVAEGCGFTVRVQGGWEGVCSG